MTDHLRSGDDAAATDALIAEVAGHRLDPYAAADRLFGRLATGPEDTTGSGATRARSG
jgi:hypothetical protein